MSQPSARAHKFQSRGISFSHVFFLLGGMTSATMLVAFYQGTKLHATTKHSAQLVDQLKLDTLNRIVRIAAAPQDVRNVDGKEHHPTNGTTQLDCSAFGGLTTPETMQELVYWKNLPRDNEFISPLRSTTVRQYLTFEPDGGGWNNIRMSVETVLAMALATGRVLVLPPSQQMYLLGENSISFGDFFPLEKISREHAGLDIISMKQFLTETYGKIRDIDSNNISLPPNGRIDWDGDTASVKATLNPWLQSIAPNPDWNPDTCMAAFPKSTDPEDSAELERIFDELRTNPPSLEDYINHPTPVNASTEERMREFMAERKELCLYTPELQNAQIIHFNGKRNLAGRLLVHFYAFLFFQDFKTDLLIKRFIRDHVHYMDAVQCAAARVIEALRQHSKKKGTGGLFDAFHIRRGDFQYKKTRVNADEILAVAKEQIPKGATVYIGTDERNKNFFNEMSEYWDVLFLDDFLGLLDRVDKTHYGMIDQLVTSRGRYFFGCWFSTFSSYITRLRGYHSQTEKAEGHELGLLPTTYYYALKEHKMKLHKYWPIKKLFYAREFPASWRNIDFDVA